MFVVPVTFISFDSWGSSIERVTLTRAASWITASTPLTAFFTCLVFLMSPFMSWNVWLFLCWVRLFFSPVEKLSSALTLIPSLISRSTMWLPMNPAPPVTRISEKSVVIVFVALCML